MFWRLQALEVMLNAGEHPITSLIVFDKENSRKLSGIIRIQACLREGIA